MSIPAAFAEQVAKFRREEESRSQSVARQIRAKSFYLPNLVPLEKSKYIFVTMEPSVGRWARTEAEAAKMLARGFRNFLWSVEDFLFHYSISTYLDNSYYITDISKLAMKVTDARTMRTDIYPLWEEHLFKEISLFGVKKVVVFFVGREVETFLSSKLLQHDSFRIIHYSPIAASARRRLPDQYPDEYRTFVNKELPNKKKIVENAKRLLEASGMDESLVTSIGDRIARSENLLSDSRRRLLFSYFKSFEQFRQ
jgi:hypothetical protein